MSASASPSTSIVISADAHVAGVQHAEDGFLLEAVRAFLAGDGVFHWEEGDGAFDADALGRDGEVVVGGG